MFVCTNWTISGRIAEVKTDGRGISLAFDPVVEYTEIIGLAVMILCFDVLCVGYAP